MDKIRVLLANHAVMVPNTIRDLIDEQDDMEVVADCRGPMKILQETGRTMANLVILAYEGVHEPGICSQLLAVYPDLTIMSVTPDMNSVYVQQLCPRRENMNSVSHQDLLSVLRKMVKCPCNVTVR